MDDNPLLRLANVFVIENRLSKIDFFTGQLLTF